MRAIRSTLEGASADRVAVRAPEPGELGWIVGRHGALYAEEYGWDERFEALVARIVADFAGLRDRRRDRVWIAEVDGAPAGCVLCVHRDEETAQLRLLLVEPSARGLGIGKGLVDECIRFARQCRYRKVVLWTQSELKAARRIYQQAGFQLTGTERHQSWGRSDLVAESWELTLR